MGETPVVDDNTNPTWNYSVKLEQKMDQGAPWLIFRVWDKDPHSSAFLGVAELIPGKSGVYELPLKWNLVGSGRVPGVLTVKIDKSEPVAEVPDVKGLTLQAAGERLHSKGLYLSRSPVYKPIHYSRDRKAKVEAQDPAPGAKVRFRSSVRLVYTLPFTMCMPDLKGDTKARAEERIPEPFRKNLAFQVRRSMEKDTSKWFKVCGQYPRPGKMIDALNSIRVYILEPAEGTKARGWRAGPSVVVRGTTLPARRLTRRNVIEACVRGGRYIMRMLSRGRDEVTVKFVREADGKVHRLTEFELLPGAKVFERKTRMERGQFRYIYFPLTGNYQVGGYSLPRHAGTTYVLALLAGMLKGNPLVPARQVEEFRRGAAMAIGYLADRVRRGKCVGPDFRCVSLGRSTDLGSTALPVVAVMEYIRQTGDRRFESLGRKMANFLLFMQQPNGEFCHIYDVIKKERNCKTKLLYYSGEAALALAMAYKVLGDRAYLVAAEKALDYQTGPYVAPFTMKFLYGEDHWTAIAANEIWPHVKKKAYARFSYGFAVYQQRQQFVPGETFDDYVGGYGITPFFPPHLTPAGSRTEAAVAAYRLSVARGEPRYDILNQIRLAFSYIIRHQVRPENSYMFVDPWMVDGAIRKSPVKYDVRIDYIQHTVSAMIHGLDLVPK